jgi:ArsR family transcriptional regulator, virulence genes transcriptional regulator
MARDGAAARWGTVHEERVMEGVDKALLQKSARRATRFLKSLANEHRMLILCNLVDGEKSVSELEEILGLRQPTLSQQLARLRGDDLVVTRRNGKSIYYSLASAEARALLACLYELYCAPATRARAGEAPARRKPVVQPLR